MRIIKCDVCDVEFHPDIVMAQLHIDEGWEGRFDADLDVDICSITCLLGAARAMAGEDELDEVPKAQDVQIGEPEGQAQPQRLRRITPEESSDITGVKMR